MFRPKNVKLYDPTSPEYSLVDSITEEMFEIHSPEILYWCNNVTTNANQQDSLDKVYGEEGDQTLKFVGPFEVFGHVETNPIIQELNRLGIEQIHAIDFYVNIAAMQNYLDGRNPLPGDLFRITYINTSNNRDFVWYEIGSVVPIDLYNFRFINWQISAEQTNLNDIPEEIKTYLRGL